MKTLFSLPALTAATPSCTEADFSSLTLPNINILSVNAIVADTYVTKLTNTFPSTKNASTQVCQVSIQYTHQGWNDTTNTWVWLPLKHWNGRFVGMGGGGWVTGDQSSLGQPVSQGYSAASTDGGHLASASTASWALISQGNLNWPLLHDFSAVALDEAASLGKLATRLFYGKSPKYSYWNGCSTGGRQGHMMAQRFPEQYDGILANAPAINWDKFIPAEFWPSLVMKLLDSYPPACELEAITDAAINACDGLDGVRDGIISLPGRCKFDPFTVVRRKVRCTNPTGTLEISRKAAQFATAVWAGAKDSNGSQLWYGLSHEASLASLGATSCTSLDNCKSVPFLVSSEWLRAIITRNTSLDLSSLTLEDYSALFRASINEFESVIGTRDPDLTLFRDAGGKMLTWHGMKDQLIFYNGTVDYYSRVLELDPNAHDYYRFFPAPGVKHCSPGPGWYPGDSFQALVDWVEKGRAPDTLVMTYVGGNPNKAQSFVCK
ncbi:Tannase/feruloyl esterase [Aspergillus pseudoustus]|uniref:Carboxylic ester hydrolase n=1 Tax=Aspergillus pseudoustus TaxID=1810923 RepID=A0ABR4IZG8_9EURO